MAKIDTLLSSHKAIDEELFERLEELLIQADVGVDTTLRLVDDVKMSKNQRNYRFQSS